MNDENIISKYSNTNWSNNEQQILLELLTNHPDFQLAELTAVIKHEYNNRADVFPNGKKILQRKTATKKIDGSGEKFDVYYLTGGTDGILKLGQGYTLEKQPEIKIVAATNNTKKYFIYGGIGLAAVIGLVALFTHK